MSLSIQSNGSTATRYRSYSRFRSAPIEPEIVNVQVNASLSLAKKTKPPEEDPYGSIEKINHDPPIFLPSHTQQRRVEVMIASDEEAYRTRVKPTIFERVERQKEWGKIQKREAKLAAQREKLQHFMERKLEHARHQNEIDLAHLEEEETKTMEQFKLNEDEDVFDDNSSQNKEIQEGFALQIMEIKERKVLSTRSTQQYHRVLSVYDRKKLAWRMRLGLVRSRDKDVSVILPWLLISRKEISASLSTLTKLGITHILNATHDVNNSFPAHFLYLKLNTKDTLETDISSSFDKAVAFIKRAEDCKGRILVHCTAGASRAPTIVMAFLVYAKKIPLLDAFNYVSALRPLVNPNQHFLYQLAMLEVATTDSCSVYFHPFWRFYEFNVFRVEQVPAARSLGMYKTVMKLYTPEVDQNNLLS